MARRAQGQLRIFRNSLQAITTALAIVLITVSTAQAQTYNVIYNFTGGKDGASPLYGLTFDRAGNLYGTAAYGGGSGYGTVFKLKQYNSNWILTPLYDFSGYDGANPYAGITFGPDGSLYGTTNSGGNGQGCGFGCGVVYNLQPSPTRPATPLSPWNETVLHRFYEFTDGDYPYSGVVFDQAGNMYGTTLVGGTECCNGTVYELQRSGGSWTESVIYNFVGGDNDGRRPIAPVTVDKFGNLYGATIGGGPGDWGSIFQMTPTAYGWSEKVLYIFTNGLDGQGPKGGLIFDSSGNIFGTTTVGGSGFGGTVFELSPSNGGWTFATIYSFPGGNGPHDRLTLDAAGSLYGTTHEDGLYGYGNVFKLTPSNGSWTYTSLYDFTNGNDGRTPYGGVVFDANGNLYGTANGGAMNNGVIYEITPQP